MGRINLDAPFGPGVDPTIRNAPTSEQQCVRARIVDHRQFQVTVERRARYWCPIHNAG